MKILVNGPENADDTVSDGSWYFDSDLELLGVLEKQMGLLEKWGFTWLEGVLTVNIDDILGKKIEAREMSWNNSSEEDRKKGVEELRQIQGIWDKMRFKPKILKLSEGGQND
jgi:hypothetical protein